jgi:hypothetical protein
MDPKAACPGSAATRTRRASGCSFFPSSEAQQFASTDSFFVAAQPHANPFWFHLAGLASPPAMTNPFQFQLAGLASPSAMTNRLDPPSSLIRPRRCITCGVDTLHTPFRATAAAPTSSGATSRSGTPCWPASGCRPWTGRAPCRAQSRCSRRRSPSTPTGGAPRALLPLALRFVPSRVPHNWSLTCIENGESSKQQVW